MSRERDAIKEALLRKGFVHDTKAGGTDHDFYRLQAEGRNRAIFTKLSRGRQYKVYGDPLMKLVQKQLQLDTRGQLNDLVDCPMSAEDYLRLLKGKGLLRD